MKIIEPSVETVLQCGTSIDNVMRHIERCARVCYRTEHRITDYSYKFFVIRLISRGHFRPLEFGTVYLSVPYDEYLSLGMSAMNQMWTRAVKRDDIVFVITNLRALYESFGSECITESGVLRFISPSISECHEKRYTFHFTLPVSIMNEFRTHISLSHLAESTRYCDYSGDRFGRELTFVRPFFIQDDDSDAFRNFSGFCASIEYEYLSLRNSGLSPQNASYVLPKCLKTELYSCGFSDAWQNFLRLRTASSAHPDAQRIASMIDTSVLDGPAI